MVCECIQGYLGDRRGQRQQGMGILWPVLGVDRLGLVDIPILDRSEDIRFIRRLMGFAVGLGFLAIL